MDPKCNHIRDRLLAEALPSSSGASPTPELAAHIDACAGCAGVWRRAQRQAAALRSLEKLAAPAALPERVRSALTAEGLEARAVASLARLPRAAVPEELDGRVVSAVHSGFLQERAVAAVIALGRQTVPSELEQRVLDGPQRTPDVLDRLVAEELADPAKAMSRRFVRRLPRLRAPAGLERRIATLLVSGNRAVGRQPRRVLVPLAAAAALVLALWGGRAWLAPSQPHLEQPSAPFRVVRAATIGDLGSMARALAGGVGGGIIDARAGGGR